MVELVHSIKQQCIPVEQPFKHLSIIIIHTHTLPHTINLIIHYQCTQNHTKNSNSYGDDTQEIISCYDVNFHKRRKAKKLQGVKKTQEQNWGATSQRVCSFVFSCFFFCRLMSINGCYSSDVSLDIELHWKKPFQNSELFTQSSILFFLYINF